MADRLRIVRLDPLLGRVILADLAAAPLGPIRDSFKVTRPQKQRFPVATNTRWDGSQPAGETIENATLTATIACYGSTTADGALAAITTAIGTADQAGPDRYVEWRPDGATRSSYYELRGSADFQPNYSWASFSSAQFFAVDVSLPVAPYPFGDPLWFSETWDADAVTSGDWILDAGTSSDIAVRNGQLVPLTTSTSRLRRAGVALSNGRLVLEFTTGSSLTGLGVEVFIAAQAGSGAYDTYLYTRVDPTNGISVGKRVNGSATLLANDNTLALQTSTTYWLELIRDGALLWGQIWSKPPTMAAQLTDVITSATQLLGVADQALFQGAGGVGIHTEVGVTSERYNDITCEPDFAMGYANWTNDGSLYRADQLRLSAIPGDAPAPFDLAISANGGTRNAAWACAAWMPRPARPFNHIWNGDAGEDADGWAAASSSGVPGRITGGKYGGFSVQTVTAATSGSGIVFRSYRRYLAQRTYIGLAWLRSPAQTTLANVSIEDDTSGTTIVQSTARALSAAWALHAVLMTGSGFDIGRLGARVRAATATTLQVSGANLFEASCAAFSAGATNSATSGTVSAVPDDWPAAPFLAILPATSELVTVRSISGTTLTLERGAEGSGAAAISTGDAIAPVPDKLQYQGRGAPPPFGILDAEACDTGDLDGFTIASPGAAYRLGKSLEMSTAGSGNPESCSASWLVDPTLMTPDEWTRGEVTFEVYAIIAGLYSTYFASGVTAILSAVPEGGFYSAGVLDVRSGVGVFTLEDPAGIGKQLLTYGATNLRRPYRLGTLRLPVDRANAARWRIHLQLAYTTVTAAAKIRPDFLFFAPIGARAASPTRKNYTGFPNVIPSSTVETRKVIRSDLSGLIAQPGRALASDNGMGGALLQLPPGPVDLTMMLLSDIPDYTSTGTTAGETYDGDAWLHVRPRPRYAIARGS